MIGFLRTELQIFLLALQFLTRIPIPASNGYSEVHARASVRHYGLVGILIGAIAALVFYAGNLIWPQTIATALSTAASILVTGAFHEDGLADTFDGIGGGTTVRRRLEIMKDSRIGTYGMVATVMVLGIKTASLSLLSVQAVMVTLIAAHGLSRLSSVLVIATSYYVRDHGTAKPVADGIVGAGLGFAVLTGLMCCAVLYAYLSLTIMLAAVTGLIVSHFGARRIFERKIGGYTGDCLGATQQISEVGIILAVLACQ